MFKRRFELKLRFPTKARLVRDCAAGAPVEICFHEVLQSSHVLGPLKCGLEFMVSSGRTPSGPMPKGPGNCPKPGNPSARGEPIASSRPRLVRR